MGIFTMRLIIENFLLFRSIYTGKMVYLNLKR